MGSRPGHCGVEVLGGIYVLACVTWKAKDFGELISTDTLHLGKHSGRSSFSLISIIFEPF